MVNSLKSNAPVNLLIIFLYAILLRWHSFVHPVVPAPTVTDGFLYHLILEKLALAGNNYPLLYPLLTLCLIVLQAFLINYVINIQKLLPKSTMLPAAAYVMLTAVFPDWWQFSSVLLVNTLIIAAWAVLSNLFNHNNPKTQVFNAGLAIGLASFFYFPALAFVFLIMAGLAIQRPFLLSEWLIALIGIIAPYYFLFTILYITNQFDPLAYLPYISIGWPKLVTNTWFWVGVLLLVIPFLVSLYLVQENMLKMLIQVRKSWSIMLVYLLFAILIPFINTSGSMDYWMLAAIPFAAFHAYTYYHLPKKWMGVTLHWITIACILAVNFGAVSQ